MILFRQFTDPIPPHWKPGVHWLVEYWLDDADTSAPCGIAYVSVFGSDAYLDYVITFDGFRGEGVATALCEAILQRWPNCIFTDPISPAGEALCRKFN